MGGGARVYSGIIMQSNRYSPLNTALATCLWCNTALKKSQNAGPKSKVYYFCSRRCEIEANFWLFQELCAIEITYPRELPPASFEGPQEE